MEKSAEHTGEVEAGDTVTYNFTGTDNGNVIRRRSRGGENLELATEA